MIYELIETGRASALFAGWQDSVVWSALQGVMGKIYVDSLEKPESGVVRNIYPSTIVHPAINPIYGLNVSVAYAYTDPDEGNALDILQ